MSHYTLRGFPSLAGQFVVAAVTGYFHSIACAAHAKGVDDSLQVIINSVLKSFLPFSNSVPNHFVTIPNFSLFDGYCV